MMNALDRLKNRLYYRFFADFIFIHINKSGGSSIETALEIPFAHKTARQYRDQIGRKRWQQVFTFTIVRNPWDKVVSHYHYRIMTNQTGLGDAPIPFDEWIRLAYRDNEPQYYNNPKMFMPQTEWITDEKGKIIVDFVGKFENLQEDFNTICNHIGKPGIVLPHLKKSRRASYKDYYSAESRKIVADWFATDIETFKYAF